MKWHDLEGPWKECLRLAWNCFLNNEIPIGAVVAEKGGAIISRGWKSEKAKVGDIPLSGNQISHAEMNAIIGMYKVKSKDFSDCTLYTTTEPCPMCFRTYIMSDLLTMKFAARAPFSGASNLCKANEYLRRKSERHKL